MTLQEMMNLDAGDIIRLKKEDPKLLRRITSRMASVARKRVARAEGLKIVPPAIAWIKRTGGIQSIRGKTISQVTAEYQRLKSFLASPQSTLTGAREFARNTAIKLGVSDLSEEQLSRLLDVWSRLKERYVDVVAEHMKYEKLLDYLHDEIKSGNTDLDALMDKADEYITDLYESAEGVGTSDFFSIGDD